jgi:hypothetical protein
MNKKFAIISAIIFSAAFIRLLPHAPNFTPLGAMALFAGAYLSNRYLAFLLPLATLVISDALMGFYGWAYPGQVAVTYASFMLITFIGRYLASNKNAVRVGLGSLAGTVIFFITTNFAVWATGFFTSTPLYPTNITGLTECFLMAIPFFQNSLMGDLVYNALFFGGFYLLSINIPALISEK